MLHLCITDAHMINIGNSSSSVGDGERESSPESSTVISQHSPLHRTDLSDSLHT